MTMNMLHPHRTGDVVVFAKPPYHFGGLTYWLLLGDHGYTPNGDEERFAAFAASGPDIVPGQLNSPVTALDIVPTVAFALGIAPDGQRPVDGQGDLIRLFPGHGCQDSFANVQCPRYCGVADLLCSLGSATDMPRP